nr:hypothetical protein [Tanacetum cinerariifolium]
PTFAPQYNMIAYLEKTKNNAKFHQILYFLTSSSIYHSLTATLNEPTPQGEDSGSGPRRQETMGGAMAHITSETALIWSIDPPISTGAMAHITSETALIWSIDPPISTGYTVRSGEDRMEHDIELTDHVPQIPMIHFSQEVTHLEHSRNSYTARRDISAARPEVSNAEPKTPPTKTTLFDDEDVTIANTLVMIKNQKAKEKGIAFKDADNSARPIRSIATLQPLPTIDPKDKGKGILQEPKPVKKIKKKDQDQIERDDEVALKIQAHLDEKARTEKERQEEASKAALAKMYDEVQAQIDADHELAVRLTHEKQEKYTVVERSGKNRAAGSSVKHNSPKKQKVNDQESEDSDKEYRKYLKVVPDDDKAINYKTLNIKSPIVDCESQVLGTNEEGDVHMYKLTRLDRSYRHFSTFSRMLKVLDRQDVLDLHKIIMKRFPANDPEGYDLIL